MKTKKDIQNYKELMDILIQFSDKDLINIHNMFCNAIKLPESKIYCMEDFDFIFLDYTPIKIMDLLYNSNYNPEDKYFIKPSNYIKTFSTLKDSNCPIYISVIGKYILEHNNNLGNVEILKFLAHKNNKNKI